VQIECLQVRGGQLGPQVVRLKRLTDPFRNARFDKQINFLDSPEGWIQIVDDRAL
jgi:hypothetical protein